MDNFTTHHRIPSEYLSKHSLALSVPLRPTRPHACRPHHGARLVLGLAVKYLTYAIPHTLSLTALTPAEAPAAVHSLRVFGMIGRLAGLPVPSLPTHPNLVSPYSHARGRWI